MTPIDLYEENGSGTEGSIIPGALGLVLGAVLIGGAVAVIREVSSEQRGAEAAQRQQREAAGDDWALRSVFKKLDVTAHAPHSVADSSVMHEMINRFNSRKSDLHDRRIREDYQKFFGRFGVQLPMNADTKTFIRALSKAQIGYEEAYEQKAKARNKRVQMGVRGAASKSSLDGILNRLGYNLEVRR